MASSKKTLTDEELFAQFEDIPPVTTDAPAAVKSARNPTKQGSRSSQSQTQPPADHDLLAELSALASARPASRPTTPRISSSTTSAGTNRRIETPTGSDPPSARNSEDRLRAAADVTAAANRKSTESSRSYHVALSAADAPPTPSSAAASIASPSQQHTTAGGGWWGTVFDAASAAVKQAEAAVHEIRANEEAMKWAEQVRGNVEKVKAYGDNVRSLAIPTFTNILQTIAPPISAHERLLIHTSHDMVGYPSMDPLIHAVFARVMSQVEGGDLLVIQRGSESRARGRSSSEAAYGGSNSSIATTTGWSDGPWWRQDTHRDLSSIKGIVEGTKLSRASAEAYAHEYFASKGGIENAAKQATEHLSESNPVRNSDIFLSVQAISNLQQDDLFVSGPTTSATDDTPTDKSDTVVVNPDASTPPAEKDNDTTAFAIYLHDPIHSIACSTMSQSFPTKWADWLDAAVGTEDDESEDSRPRLPDNIRELIDAGGIDPREWAAEWLEEILTLAIGIVAQNYVASRMGVYSGAAIARAKERVRAEEGTAGEAARAI